MSSESSYSKAFIKRLSKNKGAMFGLAIISISFFVAVFAYFIAPDHTPYANQMTVEIGGKKPGFTMKFLKVKKEHSHKTSLFSRLINGKEDQYSLLPVVNYKRVNDSIIIQKYVDEGIAGRQSFHISLLDQNYVTTKTFVLGADKFGRDILSRLIVGIRISLSVGAIAVAISVVLGILFGSLAGYFRGLTDDIIMWFINVIWSVPTLLLV